MQLSFEITKRKKYWCVNVSVRYPANPYRREYLEEHQYENIYHWCRTTFDKNIDVYRVRRMSYADFWFKNKKDLDWFLLKWSGVDISSI
jgi:hypothetical protein